MKLQLLLISDGWMDGWTDGGMHECVSGEVGG